MATNAPPYPHRYWLVHMCDGIGVRFSTDNSLNVLFHLHYLEPDI